MNKKPNKTFNNRDLGVFQKEDSVSTIYVGNLRYNKKESDLKRMFSKFGKVSYVRLIVDKKTQQSKGIAFIQMPDKNQAQMAISTLNGTLVDGRTLKVSVALDNGKNTTKRKKVEIPTPVAKEIKKKAPKKKRPTGLQALFSYLNA